VDKKREKDPLEGLEGVGPKTLERQGARRRLCGTLG